MASHGAMPRRLMVLTFSSGLALKDVDRGNNNPDWLVIIVYTSPSTSVVCHKGTLITCIQYIAIEHSPPFPQSSVGFKRKDR
jgi:hypothetical protein